MNIVVHSVNKDHVTKEAQRIKASGFGSGDRDLVWYDWKDGDNILRLLPPWNAKGFVFKEVWSHFEIPPDRDIHKCLKTWPSVFESCMLCNALDKVQAMFPDADLGKQRSSAYYYANVIDRDDEEKGVQIARVSPGVYNWIMMQMDDPKVEDFTDYEHACDLKVTKTVKGQGAKKSTRYACNNLRAGPLHESDETVVEWLSSLYDLDKVFGPLNDEAVAGMQADTGRMVTAYQRSNRTQSVSATVPTVEAQAPEEPPENPAPTQTTLPPPATDSGAPQGSLAELDPKELPSCHASLPSPTPLEDGTFGFNPSVEKCLLCPFEMACIDAKATKGL